jgi:hypothetical protein
MQALIDAVSAGEYAYKVLLKENIGIIRRLIYNTHRVLTHEWFRGRCKCYDSDTLTYLT